MRIILALLLSTLSLTISAQSFGLKGGVSISNLSGEDADYDSRTGFYFGSFLLMSEGNSIEWMPELIFQQKGATLNINNSTTILNYIDFGVNANFHINDELFLAITPYTGYLVSGSVDGSSISEWNGVNRLELGTALGIGYKINDLFTASLNYKMGFTDVYESLSARNTSFNIGIGYIFSY
jgi:hypothetical protein